MSTDEHLIRRLHPVLAAGIPEPGEPIHAEILHQICTADGLLELLDWSGQGTAADPLACLWLGSLRWHRLLTGRFPEYAPEPPPREADALLRPLFSPGDQARAALVTDSGVSSLSGLSSGQMGYPHVPAQPEQRDDAALLRVVPIGLVPYVAEDMRLNWAEQSVCLTHGAAGLRRQARSLATLFHRTAGGEQELRDSAAALEAILRESPDGGDPLIAGLLRRQLSAAAGDHTAHVPPSSSDEGRSLTDAARAHGSAVTPQSALQTAVARLAQEWERVTRPPL